ncbi:MAG: AAA family ATPase [Treponema sp.]|nr:AAA family ATPase [Treponema sp.]
MFLFHIYVRIEGQKKMRIKTVEITNFKRFTHLTVKEIPQTVKMVVLVGPNGSGKTSFFESFNHWYRWHGYMSTGDQVYIEKKTEDDVLKNINWVSDNVKITFFDEIKEVNRELLHGKFYFRTAYRNEPDFSVSDFQKQSDPTSLAGLASLMLDDKTVSSNYQRLIANTMSSLYDGANDNKTVQTLREELIGKIKSSISNIFEDLQLSSIGNPLVNGSFYFIKGIAKDFHYKNLSAGEKSAFDLILDMLIKSQYYKNAIYCIDEPEAHMHTRLQGKVLRELYLLTPDESQLWVSTHSIGMLKEAEIIEKENPNTVVFLDFGNRDFDTDETITPTRIGKAVLDKFYDLAFGDFAKLLAPEQIVLCEGDNNGRKIKNFDSSIYGKIFEKSHPNTRFISIGSCNDLIDMNAGIKSILNGILSNSNIIKFVDRDDRSKEQIEELLTKGIKATSRRHIESYLLDDIIIEKLCVQSGKPEAYQRCIDVKNDKIKTSVQKNNTTDDIKSVSGEIYIELKNILGLKQCGNNLCAFLRDTMAPLVTEDTSVYQELEHDIFG